MLTHFFSVTSVYTSGRSVMLAAFVQRMMRLMRDASSLIARKSKLRRLTTALFTIFFLFFAANSFRPSPATLSAQVRTSTRVEKRRPPNVVLIVADDLGWADLGSYGSTFHRTPNLDRLAARGVRFTNAYASSPVCSPSRASILTGKHPARLHLTDWLPGRDDSPKQKLLRPAIHQQLPLNEATIAERLRAKGYATANIGKWHLGGEGFGPAAQGFDLNIAGDDRGVPVSYFYPYTRGGETTPGLDSGRAGEYLTDRLTTEAEGFIETNKARPFFLYLPHFAVHIPMKAKPEIIAKYERAARRGATQNNPIYAAMIESLDDSIGRITRQLEQLDLIDDTLLIFTSDNGGLTVKEGANTPATSNAPLRDGKGFLYEGGIRVPLIIRWRDAAKPGGVSHTPVGGVDLFATICEIVGIEIRGITDGISLTPLLRGAKGLPRDALFWHYPHYSNQGGKPGGAIRWGDYKLIESFEGAPLELYDLARDAGETRNLAASEPRRARAMRNRLHLWRESVGAQMMTPNPAYIR